ncbi:MAG TPA: hypothetical protein VHL59_04390 [Thermoanaerobaculia bacterium]|nr:hypothetical protein [Thermoanaerobaculia bacterium]
MSIHVEELPKRPNRPVQGWGADLDPADRPAVPKERPSDVKSPRGRVGHRQVPNVKIHRSIEHPDLTPVFGTTCPPKGLSGKLRDFAYQYSEGRQLHWLTLMLADRVDVVEGMLEDLGRGRAPYVVRKPVSRRNAAIAGGVLAAIALAFVLRRLDRDA